MFIFFFGGGGVEVGTEKLEIIFPYQYFFTNLFIYFLLEIISLFHDLLISTYFIQLSK